MIASTIIAAAVATAQPATPPAEPKIDQVTMDQGEKKMACCEKMGKGEGCACCKDKMAEGAEADSGHGHDH